MVTALQSSPGVTAWPFPLLDSFARGGEDILIVERPTLQPMQSVIPADRVDDFRSFFTTKDVDACVADGLEGLGIDSSILAADIASLARSFLMQFDQAAAHLRIETVETQSCPKFHCDNVHVRLVTTYHGPTTEYKCFGSDTIHTAPLYGLVFLKGRRHPTHRDTVHHCSPKVPPGSKRLCVAIDY